MTLDGRCYISSVIQTTLGVVNQNIRENQSVVIKIGRQKDTAGFSRFSNFNKAGVLLIN
jgi:hypothetical protein